MFYIECAVNNSFLLSIDSILFRKVNTFNEMLINRSLSFGAKVQEWILREDITMLQISQLTPSHISRYNERIPRRCCLHR